MADTFDVIADTTPQLPAVNKPSIHAQRPSMEELKVLLQILDATTYTDAEVLKMTYNDRVHALAVGS